MTINWSEFFDVFSLGALIGTIIFALIIGSTYGWRSGGGNFSLFIVGLGFIIIQATALSVNKDPMPWERYAARTLLWALLCLMLVVGRSLRLRFETWRLKRKIKEVQHSNGGT